MNIKNNLSKKFAIFALAGGMAIPALARTNEEKQPENNNENLKNRIELTATDTTQNQAAVKADTTSFDDMTMIFGNILYLSAAKAVTNPDMSVYGVKAVQYMLDSLATKYSVDPTIPQSFHDYNKSTQEARDDGDPSNDNEQGQVLLEITPSFELFKSLGQFAASGQIPEKDMVGIAQYAIDKMLHEIDPHSDYYTPEEWEAMNTRMSGNATFGGFGFHLAKDIDSGYLSIRPLENSPAEKAGLKEFDLITHVDGQDIGGLPLKDVVKLLKGDVGEESTLTIKRNGQEFDVTIEREQVKSQNVRTKILDDDTGYIELNSFTANAAQEVADGIEKLKKEAVDKGIELEGFVFDLRNNGGGYIDAAVGIADLFLEQGDIVSIKTSEGIREVHKATAGSAIGDKPLVVLTNGYSASASELVSAALADNGRATVVGLNTFGKGTGQSVIPLGGGHGFKITSLHYLPPSGSLQNKGVAPHIKVAPSDTIKFKREADYGNTITNPNATTSLRQTEQVSDYADANSDFSSLKQEFKALNGGPDADLLTAIEYINKLTNDKNGTNYMKFKEYVPPMKKLTPKPTPKLGV